MKSAREDILKKIDRLTRDCDRLFADPEVIRESQIWLSKGKRPEQFNGLNRHIVVHGERTDFNTERDSLQAISFVFFLHHVISEYEVRKSRSDEADTLSNTN